jgi:hypothetical protein
MTELAKKFNALIRDVIHKPLTQIGFVRNGFRWGYTEGSLQQGVLMSRKNEEPEFIAFTLGLTAHNLGKSPQNDLVIGHLNVYELRIGFLTGPQKDFWWRVSNEGISYSDSFTGKFHEDSGYLESIVRTRMIPNILQMRSDWMPDDVTMNSALAMLSNADLLYMVEFVAIRPLSLRMYLTDALPVEYPEIVKSLVEHLSQNTFVKSVSRYDREQINVTLAVELSTTDVDEWRLEIEGYIRDRVEFINREANAGQ